MYCFVPVCVYTCCYNNLQNDGHFCHGTCAPTQPSFRSYIASTTERRTTKLPQFEEHTYRSQIVTRVVLRAYN